jgi:hypothetical protein
MKTVGELMDELSRFPRHALIEVEALAYGEEIEVDYEIDRVEMPSYTLAKIKLGEPI